MGKAYQAAAGYSDSKLNDLRTALQTVAPQESVVITFGSYARREASTHSDIDYVLVDDTPGGTPTPPAWAQEVEQTVAKIVPIAPSEGGAFAKLVAREELLRNLGGSKDTNETLTRRLLLLLEGEWLTNAVGFKTLREQLITQYVEATPKDHQLSLFLLNDIIRYWRTMTVDYMYKTTEGNKPWAIRNIKLVFSRKLMYASGLFSVGMTADRRKSEKIDILCELFALPAIPRIQRICGEAQAERVVSSYEKFLEKMQLGAVRETLKAIERGNHSEATFRELKNEGHNFNRALLSLFESTFHSTHPLRRAVIF